ANILAVMVGHEMEKKTFERERWHRAFETVRFRPLSVKIYNLVKTDVDMRIYITDAAGRIVFDSEDRENFGIDYSEWRDVRLTLAGKYGARSTAGNPRDPSTKVLYVAAPVMVNGALAGVLTIAKPTTNINNFLKGVKPQIVKVVAAAGLAAALLSYLASLWITRPIIRLTRYADEIGRGKRAEFPKLDRSEVGEMGNAFVKMQETLEGKKYVEEYVQKLTHEIKSPLSAIRGAAELLEEPMAPEQQARFLSNIRQETHRIQEMVDRMLELSSLENQKILEKMESVSFSSVLEAVIESKRPMLSQKNLKLINQVPEAVTVRADRFLLFQALANLLQNAIDFSPADGAIELTGSVEDKKLRFTVVDRGPGIPDFALEKVFDKFFSLQRPDSGKKSTGLGLNIVKEIAVLHKAEVKLENRADMGAQAIFVLPLDSGA
ncbi:MAG TPA: two-component system sensor histidine kinase CreC, partial [Candidatus Binatia bacterium]|nr:two-component system sensor histidine kinase CreC [Candidatus Binatia bacterium]